MSMGSTINDNEKEKFDSHAQDWWDKSGPLKTLHDINPTRLNFILNHTELKGQCVLDVGCGGGILSESMAKMSANVTGVDISEQAIAAASVHAQQSNLSIHYQAKPIEAIKDKQFDVITCLEMLEHVDKPEIVIGHAYRLLKAGGFLFLSTINRTPLAYAQVILAAEYILNLLPRQTHDYQKFIKPSELATMCRHAGFELVSIQGLKYNPVTRSAWLSPKPDVNYLLVCQKKA